MKLILMTTTLIFSIISYSYETDQLSAMRSEWLKGTNTAPQIDKIVNDVIKTISYNWEGPPDEDKFSKLVSEQLGARNIEYWLNRSKDTKCWQHKNASVYRTVTNALILKHKDIASTCMMNGVPVGTDKITHFFAVGRDYYKTAQLPLLKRQLREGEITSDQLDKIVLRKGSQTEDTIWGTLTTGVYSNADLVANYEGYKFHRGLFQDDIIKGKKALLKWDANGKPIVQREFTFSDYVNNYWSEAHNPSKYEYKLKTPVKNMLYYYCTNPDFWDISVELKKFAETEGKELARRYNDLLSLQPSEDFRLDKACDEFNKLSENRKKKFIEEQEKALSLHQKRLKSNEEGDNRSITPCPGESVPRPMGLVPFCKSDHRKAINEHNALLEFDKVFNDKYIKKIEDNLNTQMGLGTANLKESFFREALQGKKINDNDFNELFANNFLTRTLNAEIIKESKDNVINVEIETNFTVKENTEDKFVACVFTNVPLDKIRSDVRSEVVLGEQTCFEINKKTKTMNKSKKYFYKDGDNLVFSMENLWGFQDKEGYVYMTLPYLCKWY